MGIKVENSKRDGQYTWGSKVVSSADVLIDNTSQATSTIGDTTYSYSQIEGQEDPCVAPRYNSIDQCPPKD